MRRVTTATVLIASGMFLFEIIMRPTGSERLGAVALFGLMAIGIVVAAALLPRLARRSRSLEVTLVMLGMTSLTILVLTLLVAGSQMFISDHDLELLWVLMGFGMAGSLAFATMVSGPLTEDLTRIGTTSSEIAGGNLRARTGVNRHDEAGRLARDVDAMARALQDAEAARAGDERVRRALFTAIGHDLRTPLASMRAGVEALQDGQAPEPDRFLESLRTDVDALSRLVDDVFLMARFDSGDLTLETEVIDLTEIVDEAIEVFRPIASARGVSLSLRADDRVLATGSAEAVARVVRNLIDNATRHSPADGEVSVTVVDETRAECTVTDQGPGFEAAFIDSAFDRFTRGDVSRARGGGGAGLGLAIARGFVTAMGGEIRAEPGPGGRITFWLPSPTRNPVSPHR